MTSYPMRSLAGGEVTDELKARMDVSPRAAGLKAQVNFVTTRAGAVTKRMGSEFGVVTKSQANTVKMIPFVFNAFDASVIELGDGYARWIKDNAYVVTGTSYSAWSNGSVDYVPGDIVTGSDGNYYLCLSTHTSGSPTDPTTPKPEFWYALTDAQDAGDGAILEWPTVYELADLADLGYEQVGDILTVTSRSHMPYEFTRYTDTYWTVLPARHAPKIASPTAITSTAGGTVPGSGAGYNLKYYVTAVDTENGTESLPGYSGTPANAFAQGASLAAFDSDLDFLSTAHGLVTGDRIKVVTATVTGANRADEGIGIALEGRVFEVQGYDPPDPDYFLLKGTAGLIEPGSQVSSWPGVTISWAKAYLEYTGREKPKGQASTKISYTYGDQSGASEFWSYRSDNDNDAGFIGASTKLSFDDDGNEAGQSITPDVSQTPPYHSTPFKRGYWPRIVTYHQQRQIMASSTEDPFTVVCSRIGDIKDYSRHIPLLDSDSFQFRIPGLQADTVNGLISLGGLLIFTSGAVWAALGDGNGTLVPSSPSIRQVSYRGAGTVRPQPVDSSVIYLDIHNSDPYELRVGVGGTQLGDGYGGRPLNDYAPHLFRGYTLSRLAYASSPDSVVFAPRSDGALLGVSYNPSQELLAWHRHHLAGTGAKVYDVVSIPENGASSVYLFVCRTINGSAKYTIERIAKHRVGYADTDMRETCRFLDGSVTVNGTYSGATTLTLTGGTSWAAGETGLTLTASAGTFPGDTSGVGKGYRLVGADGAEVEVVVTVDGSTTVQTVTLLTAAPASTRATATASWVVMVTTISGLGHLEAETVYALGDGVVLGPFTVSSGAISLGSRPYGIVHVGALYSAYLDVHDLETAQGDSPLDKPVRVVGVAACVVNTRGLGVRAFDEEGVVETLRSFPDSSTVTSLTTRTVQANVGSSFTKHGRFRIESASPLPATITALIPNYEVGGRN